MAGCTNCDNTIASGKQDIVGWAWAHHALSTGCTPRFKKRFAPNKSIFGGVLCGPTPPFTLWMHPRLAAILATLHYHNGHKQLNMINKESICFVLQVYLDKH